jgi:hypothetical protein
MLAGLVGDLPHMEESPALPDVAPDPVDSAPDAAAALFCYPEGGFVLASGDAASGFMALETRERYKKFLEDNPAWLEQHQPPEMIETQMVGVSRNLPLFFGTRSLANAFDAWFERSYPNRRQYAAFLAENPTWVEENGGGGIQAYVDTGSRHVPWMQFGNPGNAKAFDAWFELQYPDLDEFNAFLEENPTWLESYTSEIEATVVEKSRYLTWMPIGSPGFTDAFDAWLLQAYPQYESASPELVGSVGFTDSSWEESPIFGMIERPELRWYEIPAPVAESGPGGEAELGGEAEFSGEPESDAVEQEWWGEDDEAVQRDLSTPDLPADDMESAPDSVRSRGETAIVVSWLTVSGVEADGTKLPGGKKRTR